MVPNGFSSQIARELIDVGAEEEDDVPSSPLLPQVSTWHSYSSHFVRSSSDEYSKESFLPIMLMSSSTVTLQSIDAVLNSPLGKNTLITTFAGIFFAVCVCMYVCMYVLL